MKKLFENFRKFVNEDLTDDEKELKIKLQALSKPSETNKNRLDVVQHK
jgi:hypothetical protein